MTDVGERESGEWRRFRGLEHHRVAAGQGGGDFPGKHQQWEIPRNHLRGDAERLRVGPVAGKLEFVGPARVVEEVRGHEWQVNIAGLSNRFSVVQGLQDRELTRALLDETGDSEDVLGAVLAGHLGPGLVVGPAGGRNGGVHVSLAGFGDLAEHLLSSRIDGLEELATGGFAEGSADEESVVGFDVHDGTRFRCGGVVEWHGMSSWSV